MALAIMFGQITEFCGHLISGEQDYHGQQISQIILLSGTIIAILASAAAVVISQSFSVMVQTLAVCYVVIGIFVIPSWPFQRKHLLKYR